MKTCHSCGAGFEVTTADLAFYENVSPVIGGKTMTIPPPTLCPSCRQQRRLAFRNERSIYRRACGLCGKSTLSIYAPESPRTVYCQACWWSDQWNSLSYGKEVDFTRPFYEQLDTLWGQVPLIALWNTQSENAEYNNNCFGLKNSYMNFNTDYGESILYSYVGEYSSYCADCAYIHHSELCYECVDCWKAYHCTFSRELENCNDCHFCTNLIGCRNCIGCHGLRHKEYWLFNEKATKEQYEKYLVSMTSTPTAIREAQQRSEAVRLKVPHVCVKHVQCENCSGDHLHQCRNVHDAYDVVESEDAEHVEYAPFRVVHVKDAYALGGLEWSYEYIGGGVSTSHVAFISHTANGLSDSYCCVLCLNGTHHAFGCVGLKKKEYCILNKQYTKEEYERLVPKVIELMCHYGEWGEYFPICISPFGYNETVAEERFPLTETDVRKQGWHWREGKEETPKVTKLVAAEKLPQSINDIPDDILNWAIQCEATKRPFKIIKQELDFYRQMWLPIPHFHPDERHRRRVALRNPRKLWDRQCAKCQMPIATSYSPDRPEIVYCEDCYIKEVY